MTFWETKAKTIIKSSSAANLADADTEMGCRISPKLLILQSHLDFFKSNIGAYSEEHGERFHQDVPSLRRGTKGSTMQV